MKKHITLLILLLTPSIVNANNDMAGLMCGPLSFMAVCNYYNLDSSIDEIVELTEFDPVSGTSMLNLYKAALKMNMPALPMKMDTESLCKSQNIGIAHVDNNHFLVVLKCENNSVYIHDPPHKPEWISSETFEERWNGNILLFTENVSIISTLENNTTHEPIKQTLVFSQMAHDFGDVESGNAEKHLFKYRNTGTDSLSLTVRTTCGCTSTILSDRIIAPQKTGTLTVILNTYGYEEGLLEKHVYIKTNDVNQPVQKLTVSSRIVKTVEAIPEHLWLGDVIHGKTVYREVKIRDPLRGLLKIESISSPDNINVSVEQTEQDTLLTLIPLIVSVTPKGPLGKFEYNIDLHTNIQRYGTITIPVYGILKSDITPTPSMLYFSNLEKGQTVERDVTVTVNENADVRIKKATVSNASVSATLHSDAVENGRMVYHVKVAFTAPDQNGIIQDTIQLYADGTTEPVTEIPLYAYIAK